MSVPERFAFFDKVVFFTFVIGVPLLLGTQAKIFSDGDTSWHLATGRWILEHGRVPTTDPFSFTMQGQPWVAHEWLADVLFSGAFNIGSYAGLAALVTLALVLTQLIAFWHLQSRVGPVAIFGSLAALILVLSPFVLARPHVLVWPLLALWTAQLIDASDRRVGPPWWLPALMVLWVNLHGSFVLGFVIYAALAADAWLAGGVAMRRWVAVGLISLAATIVNANGLEALTFPFTVSGMETLHLIEEWTPSTFDKTPKFFVVLAAVIGLGALKGWKMPPARLALLLFLLLMAFIQVRHQTWLAIVSALILPACLASSNRSGSTSQELDRPFERLAFGGAAILTALLVLALPITPQEGRGNPRSLLAAIPPDLRAQPVLNGYSFGGPLILAGIRPYIDGRADMYGDEYFADYAKIAEGDWPRFQRAVERHGIRWTMLSKSSKLVEALDKSPQWKLVYGDRVGVIHRRVSEMPELRTDPIFTRK